MFTLLYAISIQILKFFCKDRRLLLYMSRTLHLFGTDWCAMMVPIQVIRWYRMQCYDGTDSCAIVVPNRRYCHFVCYQNSSSHFHRGIISMRQPSFSTISSSSFVTTIIRLTFWTEESLISPSVSRRKVSGSAIE